ncbi:MAG: hypothetical protein NVS1B4_04230 [Gemmatimonadaceae bacterium]
MKRGRGGNPSYGVDAKGIENALVVVDQDRAVLQDRSSFTPLRTPDQLPAVNDNFTGSWSSEARGAIGIRSPRPRRCNRGIDAKSAQPVDEKTIDPIMRFRRAGAAYSGRRDAVCDLAVVNHDPSASRSANDAHPTSSKSVDGISTPRHFISPQGQGGCDPAVQAEDGFARRRGAHAQGIVERHVLGAACRGGEKKPPAHEKGVSRWGES